jgi:uncharacterized protein YfbU (UPF0304 family)
MRNEGMTERFEMRMAQSVLERVDTWRAQQDDLPGRSEAVRRLVEAGLSASGRPGEIKLTDGEKTVLVMLCQLFKQLKLTGEINPEFVEAVIHGGHYWALGWEYSGIFHGHEDSRAVVTEVVDVLDMWHFLESGFGRLSKKEKERVISEAEPFGQHVTFAGFGGNDESEHFGVARFLVDELNRFSGFKGRDLDAHIPMLDAYRRMLTVFAPIRRTLAGGAPNASQIIDILKPMRHPNRQK